MFDPRYDEQVRLLLRCLPSVAAQDCFAIKGGSAINLFVHDMPRVSVDIDLTYMPLEPRDASLNGIESALLDIKKSVADDLGNARIHETRIRGRVAKLDVISPSAQVTIEPNLILRGTLGGAAHRDLCDAAQQHFGLFGSSAIVSDPDLYGGKLCAALDRQHPRDLFDVKMLLDDTGVTASIRRAFIVYLASHNRPMHELLRPNAQEISSLYRSDFEGMARIPVDLDDLVTVQQTLAPLLVSALGDNERQFLLSMKSGDPDWDVLGFKNLQAMPALQWKLLNIRKMDGKKRAEQFETLKEILGE